MLSLDCQQLQLRGDGPIALIEYRFRGCSAVMWRVQFVVSWENDTAMRGGSYPVSFTAVYRFSCTSVSRPPRFFGRSG